MEIIERYIDVIDVLDDAGIDHDHTEPLDLDVSVPVTILGSYSPAIMWGDNARPAEYPETESDMDAEVVAMQALGKFIANGGQLSSQQKHDFLEAAIALIEIEIEQACVCALEA